MKKIAYSGIPGAFAYISAVHIFPDDELVSYMNFNEAYDAVVKDECEYAVIPIDNSYSGEVTPVMDLLFYGDLKINGVYSLPVVQNLLGVEGSTVDGIKRVISQSKALEQCDKYIRDHDFEMVQSNNTARAAKEVAELNDVNTAAIASIETAKLYGLKVLEEHINERNDNTTRFVVLSKNEGQVPNTDEDDSFIMIFTVPNIAGSLVEALSVIGKHDFNMKVVHSRPIKDYIWQYYFYVEIEGVVNTKKGQEMTEELNGICSMLKVLGPVK